mgnify:CR=1 FL=1
MTYKLCKTIIKNKTYISKEDMRIKLDVFLLNNRITQEEYNELVNLLNEDSDNNVQQNVQQ